MPVTQHDEIALITGASSGIGATYARKLAARGVSLILVARDKNRLFALADEIRAQHQVEVSVVQADLSNKADLALIRHRLQTDSEITMFVNNAGIASTSALSNSTPADIDAMIDLNVTAVTHLTSAAAESFGNKGTGTIINIASVLALAPERSNAVYGASKAYVLNLSITLKKELADTAVRIQVVLPGVTRTEIWERAGHDIGKLSPALVMDVDEMVSAALAGLDMGEFITIPALPEISDFEDYDAARLKLGPNLSRNHPAKRYGL